MIELFVKPTVCNKSLIQHKRVNKLLYIIICLFNDYNGQVDLIDF